MRRTDGFTLIELLVVILIIGILAAIAIPSFLGQRTRASDTEAKASLVSAQTAMETYRLDNDGSYAGVTTKALIAIEPTLADAYGFSIPIVDDKNFAIQVESRSKDGGGPFFIARVATEQVYRACYKPNTGGCGKSQNIPQYGSIGSW